MKEGDLPRVLAIERHSYPTPWPAWFFRRQLRAGASCWVFEKGDDILGYGVLRLRGSGWAHVMNVCVAPGQRGCGLGRKLLTHLLASARTQHAHRAWLEVRPNNYAAIMLYRSLGFRKFRVRKNYYSPSSDSRDAVIMVCRL